MKAQRRVGIVSSRNGSVGIDAARAILEAGGPALDAVVAATRCVEDNAADHSVGYGGYPNVLGEVELDASLMDGATRRAGAVGALRGYRHAIDVALAVMTRTPHVMVVGQGAALLAAELGLEPEELLTPEARAAWERHLAPVAPDLPLSVRVRAAQDAERIAGTVNFLAMDSAGHVAGAVSTSGWAWKHPGRLGDSPVIGAGNYADDRFGAAACTGWGEAAIRGATAYAVVRELRAGASLEDAVASAISDLAGFDGIGVYGHMSVVAMDAAGNHHAASTHTQAEYVSWHAGMAEPAVLVRRHLAIAEAAARQD